MKSDDLFAKLAALPDPYDEGIPPNLKLDFSEAGMDDLKAIALGQVPEELSNEDVSNAAVQAYRVIAIRGDAEDLPFFLEVLATWDGSFVDDILSEELSWVFEQLGEEVVPIAFGILKQVPVPELRRGIVSEGLEGLLENGVRVEEIRQGFAGQLRELRPERLLNGLLIGALVQNCPGEFHEEILAAYDANVVDVSITGDREEIEISLGLRAERETKRRNLSDLEEELSIAYRREILGEFPAKGDVFEKANYVIQLYRQEGGASNASILDGVHAAVICSPVMVQPTAHLLLPWDLSEASPDNAPHFADEKEAKKVSSVLMDFYNEINNGINEMEYVPSIQFYENKDDEQLSRAHPESWLLGLIMGARYLEENLGENDYTRKITKMAIERLQRIEGGEVYDLNSVVGLISPVIETLLLSRHQEKMRLAGAMRGGAGYSSGASEQVIRNEVKVGRNDPCPCGSGRKFKKCCAN